MENTTKT
jgi:RNA recognition motif-containing protein